MKPHKVISDQEFRALLDLFMCSDPWPVEPDAGSHELVKAVIDRQAQFRGYENWVVAYHELPRE